MQAQLEATNRLIDILGSVVPSIGTDGTASAGRKLDSAKGLACAWLASHNGKVGNVRQAALEAGVSPSTMQRAITERRKKGGINGAFRRKH